MLNANQVLATYASSVPVDPEAIAKQAGIKVKDASQDPSYILEPYSGRYQRDGGNGAPVIYVDRSQPKVRQRFTVAHELGHHFLGHGDSFRDGPASFATTSRQPHEVAANRFAAELLMPGEVVIAAANRRADLDQLAAGFAVSQVAMRYRLENLGLI